jgi:hypothetical protein
MGCSASRVFLGGFSVEVQKGHTVTFSLQLECSTHTGSKFLVPGIFLQVDAICEISAPTINPNSYCFSIGNPQQSPGVQP